jgi:hypothetical protein
MNPTSPKTNLTKEIPIRRRRRNMPVRFATQRTVRVIPRVAEKEQCWFTAKDYRRLRAQCVATIELVQSGGARSHDFCYRGLEPWSPETNRQRRREIKKAVLLVLSEQDSCKRQGVEDISIMAHKYELATSQSRLEAHLKALMDQQAQLMQALEDAQIQHQELSQIVQPTRCGVKRSLFIEEPVNAMVYKRR